MPLSAKELYLPTKDITAFEEKVRFFSAKGTIVLYEKYYRFTEKVLSFYMKIYPKGPKNGRTVQMNCESVNSDF